MEPNTLDYTIRQEDCGATLGTILRRELGLSRRLMNTLKAMNLIFLNGRTGYLNRFPLPGDQVRIVLPVDKAATVRPESLPLSILFENVDYLAVDKPAGMTVHPVRAHQSGTLANAVNAHLAGQGISVPFRPAGRLDRNTSGIVLVCKNRYAAGAYRRMLDTGVLTKTYLALVHGSPAHPAGTIRAPIGPVEPRSIQRQIAPDGKPAVTRYQVLSDQGNHSLVRLVMDTGRTHQIRVHMAHLGHPLLGDTLYGGHREAIHRHALHAHQVIFPDPRTGGQIRIDCSLPEDMVRALSER